MKVVLVRNYKLIERSDFWGTLRFTANHTASPKMIAKRIEILSKRMIKEILEKERR